VPAQRERFPRPARQLDPHGRRHHARPLSAPDANSLAYEAGAYAANLDVVDHLGRIAPGVGCTLPQLALAWLIAQGAVPILGAKTVAQLTENVGAAHVTLSPEVLTSIDDVAPAGAFRGDRFHAPMAAAVNK